MSHLPPIDWDVVSATGRIAAKPGPRLDQQQRTDAVRHLRAIADEAHGHAVRLTGLSDPGRRVPVLVVGRAGWIDAQIESSQAMLGALSDQRGHDELSLGEKLRARGIAAQLGGVFGLLSSRLLGQFDPFVSPARLVLVAPNILDIEKRLNVDSRQFRLWVCVHEQTHRLQFHRASWIRDYIAQLLAQTFNPPTSEAGAGDRKSSSLVDVLASPGQRAVLDKVTAVMSIIEGYAELIMNRVEPELIPSLNEIKAKFAQRRNRGGADVIVRKALSLDKKLAQYRDGAAFCQRIVELRDLHTLNRVYDSPEGLPDYDELHHPQRWLQRRGL